MARINDFDGDELNVEPWEFLNGCTNDEKSELISLLKEEGFLIKEKENNSPMLTPDRETFNEIILSLVGKRSMLSHEEEKALLKIAEPYRYL